MKINGAGEIFICKWAQYRELLSKRDDFGAYRHDKYLLKKEY
jgi:hypothetical protein